MKKQIYFPKGAKSINFDLEQGIATAVYEEERPALKVGEWAYCSMRGENALILDERGHHVGIKNCKWIDRDEAVTIPMRSNKWQPADMQEVKKLLIKEAEKRGFKEGIIFNGLSSRSDVIYKGCEMADNYFDINLNGIRVLTPEETWDDLCSNPFISDFKTGKWAEIAKKPLYVNQYGTEFFEGDAYCFVIKCTYEIDYSESLEIETTGLGGNSNVTEIMTRRECHLWIADQLK